MRAGVARDIAQKASERDALLPAAARPMKAGLAALEPAVARTGAATDPVAMAMVDIFSLKGLSREMGIDRGVDRSNPIF